MTANVSACHIVRRFRNSLGRVVEQAQPARIAAADATLTQPQSIRRNAAEQLFPQAFEIIVFNRKVNLAVFMIEVDRVNCPAAVGDERLTWEGLF